MKIFVHQEAVEVVEHDVHESVSVTELIEQFGGDDRRAWLEDGIELDVSVTLVEAGVVEFAHVHIGAREVIEVTVRFGGEARMHEFPPSATVQAVYAWAVGPKGFDLPAAQRPKHTLGLCGTQVEADRRDHVGTLATEGRVCFDLAPKVRYQG